MSAPQARATLRRAHPRVFPCALLALALLCAAGGAAAHDPSAGGGNKQGKRAPGEAPPTMNPYADQPYANCEGGYCPPADPAAEAALYNALAAGDVAAVRELLESASLNTSRNIVPDEHGFVRVKDVAVWVAAKKGQLEAMKVGRCAGPSCARAAARHSAVPAEPRQPPERRGCPSP